MSQAERHDPRGLIREAYRIEAISLAECRTIFFDWALSRPEAGDDAEAVRGLIACYGAEAPDHPMTAVLREGLSGAATPMGRRGGAQGRKAGKR